MPQKKMLCLVHNDECRAVCVYKTKMMLCDGGGYDIVRVVLNLWQSNNNKLSPERGEDTQRYTEDSWFCWDTNIIE